MNKFIVPALSIVPDVLISYMSWINRYSRNPKKYPIEKRYKKAHKLISRTNKRLKVEIVCEGLEYLNSDNPNCIMSNHLSSYDPIAYLSVLENPTTFVGKKEIKDMKFVGKIMTAIEGEFMDREDLKQSLRVMRNVENSLKENKLDWIIFPEGTRNKDPNKLIGEFHSGTFRPAMKANANIVPSVLWKTQEVLDKKIKKKKYKIYVSFLKPITPNEYYSLTTEEVRDIVVNSITDKLKHIKKD